MVYLKDKNEILGFFIVSQHEVKGRLYETGEEISIPFKDIKKVKF
jgi:sporulation protein YlmC with PRC-barrel domain